MAARKPRASLVPWLAIAGVVVVLDQLTKALIVARFALGDSVAAAQALAYRNVAQIQWRGAYCRRDIGYRAVARERQP